MMQESQLLDVPWLEGCVLLPTAGPALHPQTHMLKHQPSGRREVAGLQGRAPTGATW